MGNWVVAHSREGTWGLEILRYGPTMRKDCILPRFLLPYNHQATTHRDQPAKSLRDKPGLIQTWSLHTWGVGIPPWGRGIPQWRGGIQSWHLLPTGPGFYQAWNQEILWGSSWHYVNHLRTINIPQTGFNVVNLGWIFQRSSSQPISQYFATHSGESYTTKSSYTQLSTTPVIASKSRCTPAMTKRVTVVNHPSHGWNIRLSCSNDYSANFCQPARSFLNFRVSPSNDHLRDRCQPAK